MYVVVLSDLFLETVGEAKWILEHQMKVPCIRFQWMKAIPKLAFWTIRKLPHQQE